MHVNKVHAVFTISRVAKDLGQDENRLWDVANEMETEDGVIWDYGIGEDGVMAFTDSPTSARKPDGSHQDVRGRPRAPRRWKP